MYLVVVCTKYISLGQKSVLWLPFNGGNFYCFVQSLPLFGTLKLAMFPLLLQLSHSFWHTVFVPLAVCLVIECTKYHLPRMKAFSLTDCLEGDISVFLFSLFLYSQCSNWQCLTNHCILPIVIRDPQFCCHMLCACWLSVPNFLLLGQGPALIFPWTWFGGPLSWREGKAVK
jgi:hypothetical protein